MGWDTEVIIIAENIKEEQHAYRIMEAIFYDDAQHYELSTCYLKEESTVFSLYYHFERRKVIPYWIIEKISSDFPKVVFTALGDCPDFICGPAGWVRIINGKIKDSYGIRNKRQSVLSKPGLFMNEIYDWFRQNGPEDIERQRLLKDFPIGSCVDNYYSKVVPIDGTRLWRVTQKNQKEKGNPAGWNRIGVDLTYKPKPEGY